MARHLLAWIAVLLAIGGTAGGLGYYKYAEISAAIAAAEAFPEPREAVEAVRVRELPDMLIGITIVQGLLELVGISGFLVGCFLDLWWVMVVSGLIMVLDDIFAN